MRKKSVNVKEPTELELKFEDGKSLTLLFDVEALLKFNDLPGGLAAFVNEQSIPERCAMVLYIGNKDLEIDEARKLVSNMDPGSITEIMLEFTTSMGATNNQMLQELQKKTMQEFMVKMNLK